MTLDTFKIIKTNLLLLTILFIATILVIGIWCSYPNWDDAWLFMLIKEHGHEAIPAAIPDRPLAAFLIQGELLISPIELIIISVALWIILGLLTGQLLEILFPSLAGYKPLCIVLSMCPVLTKIHLVVYNATPTALLAVILGYSGFILLHTYITSETQKRFTLLLGILLFVIGILISEYTIPVVLISIILFLPHIKNDAVKRKAFIALSFLILTVGATYPLVALHARDNTSPLYALQNLKGMFKNLPFTLFGSLWQSVCGAYTESLGFITQLSLHNKPGLLCFIVGVCIAIPLVFTYQKSRAPKLLSIMVPLVALVAGVLPVCLMSRLPYPDIATRFLLPLTPLSAVVFVFLLTKMLSPRFWFLPGIFVGLICGSSVTQLVLKGIKEEQETANYSEILKPLVTDSGLVIAVIDSDLNDYTLTGKITKTWPVDKEIKFWALNRSTASAAVGPREDCEAQKFQRDIRLVQRLAPVDKIIIIHKDGSTENYCIEKSDSPIQ